ncbi:transposase [Pseudonocardia sp. TRM90224]|uniref:transposase n=1 Tax=Pseudonocardia sp. TRM90224 TaxID=2812678 RepID=UPI001E34E8FD|nr:transposase [Pseudonocardia sp. TRM90224]
MLFATSVVVTTLLDPDVVTGYPASEIIALYHERWEIETAYFELKSTTLGGRVLRARTPAGIDREIHALLITYQALPIRRYASRPATPPSPGPISIPTAAASPLPSTPPTTISVDIIPWHSTLTPPHTT